MDVGGAPTSAAGRCKQPSAGNCYPQLGSAPTSPSVSSCTRAHAQLRAAYMDSNILCVDMSSGKPRTRNRVPSGPQATGKVTQRLLLLDGVLAVHGRTMFSRCTKLSWGDRSTARWRGHRRCTPKQLSGQVLVSESEYAGPRDGCLPVSRLQAKQMLCRISSLRSRRCVMWHGAQAVCGVASTQIMQRPALVLPASRTLLTVRSFVMPLSPLFSCLTCWAWRCWAWR